MSNAKIRKKSATEANQRPQEFVIKRTGIYADDEDALHRKMYDLARQKISKLVNVNCTSFPLINYEI